jgi:hypothetical protein
MRDEQNRFFDEHCFNPACQTAQATGVNSALGQTVVYDSFIQSGFRKVVPAVAASIGTGAMNEQQWIQLYFAARRRWLSSLRPPLPQTAYRMDAFAKLSQENEWDLQFTPTLTVHGVTFSAQDLLNDPLPIVRASASDQSDRPSARILLLMSSYMKGDDDVLAVQQALNLNVFTNDRDGSSVHSLSRWLRVSKRPGRSRQTGSSGR